MVFHTTPRKNAGATIQRKKKSVHRLPRGSHCQNSQRAPLREKQVWSETTLWFIFMNLWAAISFLGHVRAPFKRRVMRSKQGRTNENPI